MYVYHWELWYFNYWLTHCFYFCGGLIIILAIGKNKYDKYKKKIAILNRLEKYGRTQNEWLSDEQYLTERFEKWALNQ